MFNDFSWSGVAAGVVAVLISFASSAAIIFQAVAAGATPGQFSSWIGALGLGIGATCIGLSLYYRMPVVTAWSTPGASVPSTHSISSVLRSFHELPEPCRSCH